MNSLKLLKYYYRNEHVFFTGNVEQEIALQNKQSLAPFLYFVCGDKFLNVYLGSTLIQEKFFALQREITKLFNENKIKHYFIKGSVLANLYPDSALRTRGDIDVVVQECDFERALTILKSNNFKYKSASTKDANLYKNDLLIELHKKLVDTGERLDNYFNNGFSRVIQKDEYLYELDYNFHFIYLVFHLNKHLKTGEGLRSLLDFYYLDKAYSLDYKYIEKELKQINLLKLYITICNCIYEITNKRLPGYTGENVSMLLDYMLTNGVHGIEDLKHSYEKELITKNESKIKYLWNKLFINKFTREKLYPKLSKCILGYPIIIIHRFFYLVFNKNKNLKQLLNSNTDDYKYTKAFYDNYGIIDKE